MAGTKGSGPHHVEFGKPDFSEGKTKNRLSTEGAASLVGGEPPSGGHSIRIKYAFGKDVPEAYDRLQTSYAVNHYNGLFSAPMDWEHPDDPASPGYAIEYLLLNPDGSLHDRLRVAYEVASGVGGARAASDPRMAVGFEARVIRPSTGYDHYFVWRPEAAKGFVKSKVADLPTFNKIWQPALEIDVVQSSIFDAIPSASKPDGSALDILAGSFLCKSGPTTVHLLVTPEWTQAGLGSALKFKIQNVGSFDYCGFERTALVESSSLLWPPGRSLSAIPEGAPINYTEAEILAS